MWCYLLKIMVKFVFTSRLSRRPLSMVMTTTINIRSMGDIKKTVDLVNFEQ